MLSETPSAVLQSLVERVECLLLLATIRAQFRANPREMSQKAVAIERLFLGYLHPDHDRNPQITDFLNPPFGGASRLVEIDDSAFQSDGNGMGSIMNAKPGENALHVALDGFFCDGELDANLFVSIPP